MHGSSHRRTTDFSTSSPTRNAPSPGIVVCSTTVPGEGHDVRVPRFQSVIFCVADYYSTLSIPLRLASPLSGPDQGDQSSRAVSCLGLKGERALFESLASGRTGAFVAWVKGGHEVRQECKFAVTHILDLLAAPRGQAESFFRRGTQLQRASGGRDKRVGITAKRERGIVCNFPVVNNKTFTPVSARILSPIELALFEPFTAMGGEDMPFCID